MKISIQNISRLRKRFKQTALICLTVLAATGCKKDNPGDNNNTTSDGSTIKFVLNDNFNFSVINGALAYVGITGTLAKPGPYTFLAPDNNAFILLNMPNPTKSGFDFYTKARLTDLTRYCILPQKISFKHEPLVQNKPLLTATGGNVYLTRYLNGTDTVTTINGLKLTSADNAASNGYIQVLPQVPNPETYSKVMDYLHNDTTLTLFAAALHRANLDVSLLAGKDAYTLMAPSNAAFQNSGKLGLNLGVSTLDSIFKADPVKLAAFLKYHIIKDRFFEGDLYRYTVAHPDGIQTLDGSNVNIGGNPAGFHAITFTGRGNQGIPAAIARPQSGNQTVYYANIPCGNAVIHIIDRVLIK